MDFIVGDMFSTQTAALVYELERIGDNDLLYFRVTLRGGLKTSAITYTSHDWRKFLRDGSVSWMERDGPEVAPELVGVI